MNIKIRKLILIIVFMLAGMLLISTNKCYASESTTVDNCTYVYDVNENGEAENVYVSAYESEGNYININIPDNLNGHTVVSIGNGGNNIINKDFYGTGYYINELRIPDSVRKINAHAFDGCRVRGNSIHLPNNLEEIEEWAFANFSYSHAFAMVNIPNSVKKIGDFAFANLLMSGMSYSEENNKFQPDGAHWSGDGFPYGGSKLVLGSGVETIGKYAFINQMYITEEITIPTNVSTIGEGAFLHTSATRINIEDRTNSLKIDNYAFAATRVTDFTIKPNYELGKGVFANCEKLESVTFEDGNTIIPKSTFYNCTNLENIVKTNSIEEIGDQAFCNCDKIDYQNIVQNIKKIGNGAFMKCDGISGNIIINDYVEELGEYVFSECTNLKSAEIRTTAITEIPARTFKGDPNLLGIIKPNQITKVGNEAFSGCTSLEKEEYNNILANITSIGNGAFSGCTGLDETLTVPVLVSELGDKVFAGCTNLPEVILEYNYTKIPNGLFSECTSLENVTIQDSVTEIGDEAFYKCTSINMEEFKDITRNTAVYGSSAFEGCTGLEGNLLIKNIVTKIGVGALRNCTNVTNIEFQENATTQTFDNQCFYNTAAQQEIFRIHASGRTKLGQRVFTDAKEVYFDATYRSDTYYNVIKEYKWYGNSSRDPIVHYGDCTHNIDITCTLPGVTLVNPNTGEELSSLDINCEDNFEFKLKIEDAYAEKYPNLIVKLVSEGQYSDSDLETKILQMRNGDTYTLEKVNRDKQIQVLAREDGADLVLRQFISQKNGGNLTETREPSVLVNKNKMALVSYNHTKYPLNVKPGDKITYAIRVYNEGTAEGEVNEIKVRLQEGLTFDETNNTYNWTVSDDGRTITTDYLQGTKIPAFTERKPEYLELTYMCEVTSEYDLTDKYMVTLAEISSGNDNDSAENTVGLIDIVDYKKQESYTSSRDTYTQGDEDDTDFEAVSIKAMVATNYKLVVSKIDSLDNELLNGAVFNLLNENKEIIKTETTRDGTVDFGEFDTYGEGTDTYYIEEAETPAGYIKTFDGLIELQVIKTLNEHGDLDIHIIYDVKFIADEEFETEVNESLEFIPITSKEDLLLIGTGREKEVNGVTYSFTQNANYRLQNNIDMEGISITPIDYMNGIFDGNDFTISNFVINGDELNTVEVGLFRSFKGEIRNLNVEVNSINGQSTTEGKNAVTNGTGSTSTAALVGFMYSGLIKNCTISGGTINANNMANVGGFVGETGFDGTVKFVDCTFSAQIVAGTENAGGFIGCSHGKVSIENSTVEPGELNGPMLYNAGGFIGNSNGDVTIKDSTNKRSIQNGNTSNVGGFIGFASANNTVNIDKCDNEATIVGKDNVGGIIGYSESIVNVSNSNNAITTQASTVATGYNAGGIIGKSYPIGSANSNVIVQIDNDGHIVNVYVKNKKTTSNYNMNVVKVDLSQETEKQNLSGAKFNIYNSEGKLIKENEEVDSNGQILIENIPINSLIPDIYYIEEKEPPKGYEILIKGIVKVKTEKEWDGVNQEYVLKNTLEILDNLEDLEEITEIGNGAGRDEIPDNIVYENVRYKSSKTGILNCTNKGMVNSQSDSGGIAGCIVGCSTLENCESTGEFSSRGISGGIVAELMQIDITDESTVKNCNNFGKIQGTNIGGIVGITSIVTQISNCTNEGNLEATATNSWNIDAAAGGILGRSIGIVEIDSCENKSNVRAQTAGGIVGNSSVYSYYVVDRNGNTSVLTYADDSLAITNCNVDDSKISASTGSAGGILGSAGCTELVVDRCKVENSTITAYGNNNGHNSAGIVGVLEGKDVYIDNCDVIKTTIASDDSVSGIAGNASHIGSPRNPDWYMYEEHIISINNCNVLGDKITTSTRTSSGILGYIYDEKAYITILDCNVGSYENEQTIISGREQKAGIFAGAKDADLKVEIGRCNVDGATIAFSGEPAGSTADISGIMGYIWTTGSDERVDIDIYECNVSNNTFAMNSGEASVASNNIGGITAGSIHGMNINIRDCNVIKNTFVLDCGDVGGIVGSTYRGSGVPDDYAVNIENCIVKDLNVSYNKDITASKNNAAGGIVGSEHSEYLYIKGCEVSGISITNGPGSIGGILGNILATTSGCLKIENSKVTAILNDETQKVIKENRIAPGRYVKNIGGAVGGAYAADNVISINDVACDKIIISTQYYTEDDNVQIGGLAGFICGKLNMENVLVDGLTVNDISKSLDVERENKNTVGGLIGDFDLYGQSVINNVTVKNEQLNTEDASVSGVIASIVGRGDRSEPNLDMSDITVDNCIIHAKNTPVVAGIVGTSVEHILSMSNVVLKNSEITLDQPTKINHAIGGIVAIANPGDSETSGGSLDINYAEVNNVKFVSKQVDEEPTLTHIGGIVAVSNEDIVLNDCKVINGTEIINENESAISGEINLPSISGGLVGFVNGVKVYDRSVQDWLDVSRTAIITNSSVEDIKVTGKTIVGGLVGCAKAKISNNTVTNPIITGNGLSSIVGGAIGIAKEGSELSEITVQADEVEEDEEMPYGVFSEYLAGGIVGINSGRLKNSIVKNIIVKTAMKYVEDVDVSDYFEDGDETDIETDIKKGSNEELANAIQVRSNYNSENCDDVNVTVILGE